VTDYIDLHCHYLPNIDDGVRSVGDGLALCVALKKIGFGTVMATPHMRTAMFDNDKMGLTACYEAFAQEASQHSKLPALGLGSEHYFDDVFWERFGKGETLPYPGGKAVLVEVSQDGFPMRLNEFFFQMNVRGVRPVLAHPERYAPLWKNTDALEPMTQVGALPLLDVMSLVGKYGRRAKDAAERMLGEGVYAAACSDAHHPSHVEMVAAGIERLKILVGPERTERLLGEHPRLILEGTFDP